MCDHIQPHSLEESATIRVKVTVCGELQWSFQTRPPPFYFFFLTSFSPHPPSPIQEQLTMSTLSEPVPNKDISSSARQRGHSAMVRHNDIGLCPIRYICDADGRDNVSPLPIIRILIYIILMLSFPYSIYNTTFACNSTGLQIGNHRRRG